MIDYNNILIFISNFFFTIIFVLVLYNISDMVTSFGTYKKRNDPGNLFLFATENNKESFLFKIFLAYVNTIRLSLPFLIIVYIYISRFTGIDDISFNFSLALFITLIFLTSIRIASNPTKTIRLRKIQEKFLNLGYDLKNHFQVEEFFRDPEVIAIAKLHKERVLSFFYTILIINLLIIFLLYLEISLSDFPSILTKESIEIEINAMVIFNIIRFFIFTFIFVLFSEFILWKFDPIIQD